MVLIFWAITPLQSSVLGTRSVLLDQQAQMALPSQFMDSEAQAAVLDQSVLNAAYAMTWLQQPDPPFTNADFALIPFQPTESTHGNTANWAGITTKYWTDLQCWPANITNVRPALPGAVAFDNGRGCYTGELDISVSESGYNLLYIGWWNSGWANYYMNVPTCGPAAVNEFVAAWVHGENYVQINMSAIFCEASYHKQQVKAVVQADASVPIETQLEPLGPEEVLSVNEFNNSAFNYLLGAGVSAIDIPREFPFTDLLDQWPLAKARGLDYPLWSPLVGFALGGNNMTLAEFADHEVLRTTFQAVHRRIFSAAFPMVLSNSTDENSLPGRIHLVKFGVVVSRLYTTLIESFLGVVTILVLMLSWICHRSQSMLAREPGSLHFLFGIVQDSSLLLRNMSGTGSLSAEKLQEKLGDCRFKLVCGCRDISGKRTLRLIGGLNEKIDCAIDGSQSRGAMEHLGHYSPIKPLALRQLVGVLISVFICAAMSVLTYLWYEQKVIGG